MMVAADVELELAERAERARAWLVDACFAFWAERGPHPAGGFRETLNLDGTPNDDTLTRVRVQARQTYVFAHALMMGWEPARAEALIRRGVEAMTTFCRRPDGLFGKMAHLGRGLDDDQPELYDNAFIVMGLAWAARALKDDAVMEVARETLRLIDERLGHPAGGWRETWPERSPRRQNPHMHMFEASLAYHQADPAGGHLARAAAVLELFETRFVDRASGRLFEFFEDDWTACAHGQVIEPGHEFEWAWLICRYGRLAEQSPRPVAGAVYAKAASALDARGLAPQQLTVDGATLDGSRRTWQQTEALKAHLAMAQCGVEGAHARALATFDALWDDYIAPAPRGAWIDCYDAQGRPAAADIPASTGYHVVMAMAETIAFANPAAWL